MVEADKQPIDHHDQHSDRHGKEPRLHKYLRAMAKEDASDLHFKANKPPRIRKSTRLYPAKSPPLSGDEILSMVEEILTEKQLAFFREYGSLDVAEELEGSDRFRMNIYRQRGEVSIAVRRVSRFIPTLEELNLPPQIRRIAEFHRGLVLVTGITGAGKSTTLATMLEHINETRPCHIVTIEDPIEYIYEEKKAQVNQREVGIDVPSFDLALKYLLREDPDVVLLSDMRDLDTFEAALQAAETGHLVFGTVHASSAASTVGRILDLYPQESRDLARQSLEFNLRAVICQRLLPCLVDGIDRVPAVEILMMNPSARKLIEEERDAELLEVIRASEHEGMQDFNKSLLQLIEKDYVDPKVAYEVSPNADELKMLLKGISASRAGLLGR